MTNKVTIQPENSIRKVYDEYLRNHEDLKRKFYETDNRSRKERIQRETKDLRSRYGGIITRRARAEWEQNLASFDTLDKSYAVSERKAKTALSKSAGEYLPVAKAEVSASQTAEEIVETYENAEGDDSFRYALALEAQGRLGELANSATTATERAEVTRHIKSITDHADGLYVTDKLQTERGKVVESAEALQQMQTEYYEINQSFKETGLNMSLARLEVEHKTLDNGHMRTTYRVHPPVSFEGAIERGLGEDQSTGDSE